MEKKQISFCSTGAQIFALRYSNRWPHSLFLGLFLHTNTFKWQDFKFLASTVRVR